MGITDPIVKKYFGKRKIAIASMHGKQQVIAPVLQESLGLEFVVPQQLNTDQLGTFSGEVERLLSPLEVARKKCLMAAELTGATLAIASEGSFGPHPAFYFLPADEEIVLLMDLENQWEFKAKKISTETNFSSAICYAWEDVTSFATKALFPSHALLLREDCKGFKRVVKGVKDPATLERETRYFLNEFGKVHIETDMRAMCNPTRMKVIKQATEKLVQIIHTLCPACGTPGFEIVEAKPGLPCVLCGTPTNSTFSYVRSCQQCQFFNEEKYPHGKQAEDPQNCNRCNP